MPLYSHSRLSAFEKCPLQYKYRYLDKIKRDTQSIEAFLGNRVHEALETLYRDLMASKRPTLEELLTLYRTTWDSQFSNKITIVKTDLGPEHYRRTGEECITRYYRRNQPFQDGATLGLEEQITVSLDAGGRYQIQGYIDRLVRAEDGVLEIHDYKTSGFLPSTAALRRDRQLALYQMAIEKRFPGTREIRLVWHYLVFDQRLKSSRTPEEIERHRRQTMGLIDRIESTQDYPPRESALCRWCEYRDICPLFAKRSRPLDRAVQLTLFPSSQF